MIELAFGESAAGGLKIAKSTKQGDPVNGAVAVLGGTRRERREILREAKKPRTWSGVTMEGSPKDVAALSLALDMGDISDIDTDMKARKRFLDTYFSDYPGVSNAIWETNQQAIMRIQEAKSTLEPIRMWICVSNPAELCGLHFICHLMSAARTPLSVVRIPNEIEKENSIISYRGTGDIDAELLGGYVDYDEPVSDLQRKVYATLWCTLVKENTPLRAVVNGTLISVSDYFYDFALRASMPDTECTIAQLIGTAMGQISGVGDQWLYLRVKYMLNEGELITIKPAKANHPYSQVINRRKETV
jgi:hypothetical protein